MIFNTEAASTIKKTEYSPLKKGKGGGKEYGFTSSRLGIQISSP